MMYYTGTGTQHCQVETAATDYGTNLSLLNFESDTGTFTTLRSTDMRKK
jgi:hypothetical protein